MQPPAAPCVGIAPTPAFGRGQCVSERELFRSSGRELACTENLNAGRAFAQLLQQFSGISVAACQQYGCRLAVQHTLDAEVAITCFDTFREEPVGIVEQGEIHPVQRIEGAVHITVRQVRRPDQVFDNLLVFDSIHSCERHRHSADYSARPFDFGAVTLAAPAQPSFGCVVRVVVEERRDRVVEAVEVVIGETRALLGVDGTERSDDEEYRQKTYSFHIRCRCGFSCRILRRKLTVL